MTSSISFPLKTSDVARHLLQWIRDPAGAPRLIIDGDVSTLPLDSTQSPGDYVRTIIRAAAEHVDLTILQEGTLVPMLNYAMPYCAFLFRNNRVLVVYL